MSPRRVLIAGCGDVGTRLGLMLADAGEHVFGLRRDTAGLPASLHPVTLDLEAAIDSTVLPPAIDALVFAAAPDARDEVAYQRLFVDAPRRLLDALTQPPQRIVFVSSTAVYAQDDGEWVDETSPAQPLTFNGRLLLHAEHALQARAPGAVVLRLSGLYGPGRNRILRRAIDGDAGAARWSNRIHVQDAAAAIRHLLALDAPEALYLGSDDAPEREDLILAWLRTRHGLPPGPVASGDGASGRRILNRRLRGSGFEFEFPDYRAGLA